MMLVANSYTDDYGPWPFLVCIGLGVALLWWRRAVATGFARSFSGQELPLQDRERTNEQFELWLAVMPFFVILLGVFMVVGSIAALAGLLPE